MRKMLASLALGAALAWTGPALAQADAEGGPAFSTVVDHRDLDLTSRSGQAALDRRMRAAATAGCSRLYRGDAASIEMRLSCAGRSMAAARRQPALARIKAGGTLLALGKAR